MHIRLTVAAFALAALFPSTAGAQAPRGGFGGGSGSPLAGLANPHAGTAKHEGSWDRSGGNGDMRGIKPGETLTIFDAKGPATVKRFWVTIAPRTDVELLRQTIIRMYWDGETSPSVECPIGDFFGVGFGQQVDFQSMPLNETSGGYNCYWPMPFHTSAKWTIENRSKKNLDAFYYNIDYTAVETMNPNLKHFHASWRRENPTKAGTNYTILEAEGDGHYVGTALFMQNRQGRGLGFLEGDEMVYIDGETTASIIGTGTEDYFSSGWYYDRGVYSANYHGIPIKDETLGRVSTYRWHIEDAMPFHKSIKFTIEHGHANDHVADYSSVAYFYQSEPHKAYPPLPADAKDLLPWTPPPPMKVQGAIEGESLVGKAKADVGAVAAQPMDTYPGQWSGGTQLWWTPAKANGVLTFQLPVREAGTYDVTAYLTKANDYGAFRVSVNGREIPAEIDLYSDGVVPTGPLPVGSLSLKAGDNEIKVTNTGKHPLSKGYLFGLDCVVLKPQ
jgi:hypothetical protein